jgi:hypothetical protein
MTDISLLDELEKETHRLATFYRREARRCHDTKAYLAGCVMLGAALEATLLVFANCYAEEVAFSADTQRKQISSNPLARWTLAELLAVSKLLQWLPSGLSKEENWSRARARIGDYAEVVRQIRNHIHPARYAEDFHRKRATKRYFDYVYEILDVATDYLVQKSKASLRLHLASEDELDAQTVSREGMRKNAQPPTFHWAPSRSIG